MAWFGRIDKFAGTGDGWEILVIYYNDVAPNVTFPRVVKLPIDATKPQAVNAIQVRGAEVRQQAKLNEENFVGQIIPIP